MDADETYENYPGILVFSESGKSICVNLRHLRAHQDPAESFGLRLTPRQWTTYCYTQDEIETNQDMNPCEAHNFKVCSVHNRFFNKVRFWQLRFACETPKMGSVAGWGGLGGAPIGSGKPVETRPNQLSVFHKVS